MARELGLGITLFALLADGVLSGKYATRAGKVGNREDAAVLRFKLAQYRMKDRTLAIINAVAAVAERHQVTSAQIAIAWAATRPSVSSAIVVCAPLRSSPTILPRSMSH